MGKSKGKHRLDKFYHLAKEQGYRSRAAFKLVQLNRKYDFLSTSRVLLDLCAAPGGWLQVASKAMPVGSKIIGVDLEAIRPIPGCTTIVGDITSQKTRQDLKKLTGGQPVDTVIHDGAPNIGGVWASEAYTQSALVLDALRLATETLGPKGTFVTKIFRSQDYNSLLYAFKQLFNKVDATKPVASRNTSAEIFVVCQGYKAPTKIDSRLLDSKHLFKEVVEAPKKMGPDALLKDKFKTQRHRTGYEEGISSSHKALPATAFILSDNPVPLLGVATSFVLDGEASEVVPQEGADSEDVVGALGFAALAARIRQSEYTTPEIKSACADLQVLGRSDFKALLKWRLQIKKAVQGTMPDSEPEEAEKAEPDSDAAEEALLEEMKGVRDAADHRLKKERKRRREQRMKSRVRAAQMALSDGVNQDAGAGDETLFSLSTVRGRGALAAVADAKVPEQAEMDALEADAEAARQLVPPEAPGGSSASDTEADEEYAQMTEEALEDAYVQYLNRKGQRDAATRRRARLAAAPKRGDPNAAAFTGANSDGSDSDTAHLGAPEFDPPDEVETEEPGGGLLTAMDTAVVGRATTDAAIAAQWFAQDVFAAAPTLDHVQSGPTHKPGVTPALQSVAAADGSDSQNVAFGKPTATAAAAAKKPKPLTQQEIMTAAAKKKDAKALAAVEGFEVVPKRAKGGALGRDSDDSSDDDGGSRPNKALLPAMSSSDDDTDDEAFMDGLDGDGKAEIRALAKRMLRKRSRDELLEGSYNKYAFHDAGLPRWFDEDQRRHARAPQILTREELDAAKAEMKAIDARPIKKVLEARARKKKRLQVSLDKAKAKSEAVVGQEDVPMKSKMKEIQKIYAKARAAAGQGGAKGDKKKKAGTGRRRDEHKSKGRPLDGRMLSDKRETGAKGKRAAAKAAKKGKKGKGPKPTGKKR